MTLACYIVDGTTQVVLTPETEFEKRLVRDIPDGLPIKTRKGSFYECSGGDYGGWYRQTRDEQSLILRLDTPSTPSQP